MRLTPTLIWDTWANGGPFIGELRPTGRVTIEWDWHLNAQSTGTGALPVAKKPIRWFQRCDDSQDEMELPPIKSIQIDRSIDSDAGAATIVFYNQQMRTNSEAQPNLAELGKPGYYSMARGLGAEANARWGQVFNEWCFAITPNTLVRTYQGYGGRMEDATIEEGIAAGNLVRTGVWFCDRVKVGTDGLITMECRDAAKLLIEQQLYPPLVPRTLYPLRYQRYEWKNETVSHTTTRSIPAQTGVQRSVSISDSTVDRWYPKGATGSDLPAGNVLHGHRAADSIDNNTGTFALSVGNGSPTASFAADWWEYNVDGPVDTVYVFPWGGNYQMYISVLENGEWIDGGAGSIPYDNGPLYGNQPYVVDSQAGIPYVMQAGVPWEASVEYKLPRVYEATKVRVTFRNPTKSQWGPLYYRSGIREFQAKISQIDATTVSETTTETVQVRHDGNYKDYSDIVKDLLLWAGFWCYEVLAHHSDQPHVHGNIESTGIYAEDPLPDDLFDKRPVIDPITELKETVGYVTWVDDEGAFHFESPNWWQAGNFDEDGTYIDFIPEIDEKVQLTGYTIDVSDDMLRSEIIIAEENSREGPFGVVTRYTPPTYDILRGMVKPAMWTNGYFTNPDEQKIMAELIGLHIYFRLRMSQVEAWANPCIQVNDQVRVYERITSTTFIHYVRGVQTQMDCDTGQYTMSLTTHWLGHDDDWAVDT